MGVDGPTVSQRVAGTGRLVAAPTGQVRRARRSGFKVLGGHGGQRRAPDDHRKARRAARGEAGRSSERSEELLGSEQTGRAEITIREKRERSPGARARYESMRRAGHAHVTLAGGGGVTLGHAYFVTILG